MTYFYSDTTKGFYTPDIHGDNIPKDAVELSTEAYTALLDGQKEGKIIAVDSAGIPVLIDPPPAEPPKALTPAEKLEKAGLTVDELKTLLGL